MYLQDRHAKKIWIILKKSPGGATGKENRKKPLNKDISTADLR